MLSVCGHYKYFNSFITGTVFICQKLTSVVSAGTVFIGLRQNLMSIDVCIKTVPVLKELRVLDGVKDTAPETTQHTLLNVDEICSQGRILWCSRYSNPLILYIIHIDQMILWYIRIPYSTRDSTTTTLISSISLPVL